MREDEITTLTLADEAATAHLAATLCAALLAHAPALRETGFNLRLEGNLGAGKTTFTRALLRAAGFAGRVKSPTFELVTDYDFTDGITLHHFDFYRFEDPREFDDAGFRDLFGAGNVCVSEWSEKAEPLLPAADLVIELTPETPLSRTAKMTATTELGRRVLKKVQVTP